jgi:hypothetical protein
MILRKYYQRKSGNREILAGKNPGKREKLILIPCPVIIIS